MLIKFDVTKLIQAAAVLVKGEPGLRMSRLRLLKLLYIADREYLQSRARPITGDRVVALDHGPVLSSTYDMIKGQDFASDHWGRYLRTVGRDVELVEDPGVSKLTRFEIEKLQEVGARYRDWDDWAVAEYTHSFSEWLKNVPAKGSGKRIPLDDILEAVGLVDRKEELLQNERREHAVEQFFSDAKR